MSVYTTVGREELSAWLARYNVGEVTELAEASATAEPPAPGESPLDEGLRRLQAAFPPAEGGAS